MRKYLLHQFMTAFVAFPFNFILEKPTKKFFAFVKVPILLLTSSVRVRFGFGDFSSGSGHTCFGFGKKKKKNPGSVYH